MPYKEVIGHGVLEGVGVIGRGGSEERTHVEAHCALKKDVCMFLLAASSLRIIVLLDGSDPRRLRCPCRVRRLAKGLP